MSTNRWLLLVLAVLLAPSALFAQEMTAAELEAMQAASRALGDGRYLAAAEAVRPLAFDAAGQPRPGFAHDEWVRMQALMLAEPPTRPAEPALAGGVRPPPVPAEEAAALRAAIPRDAIAEIVARARLTRVVILNEDHGLPRSRAFALEVARALRPLGYSVLAAETFSNWDANNAAAITTMARTGQPTRRTGFYTADPVFADFVRQSLALGYRPLGYEITGAERGTGDGGADVATREEAQANHLAAALKADPAARFLVHVGYAHAAEAPLPDGSPTPTPWMAARLKAKTGIDPLTIDQTVLFEQPSFESPERFAMVADRLGRRSAVLFAGDRPLVVGQYAGAIDLQVVHPRARRVNGRPDWLAGMGRKPTPIPPEYLPGSGTRLVQAFVASEAEDAIPVDQVLVTAGTPAPMLMLPAVPVRYAVQDPDGAPGAGAGGAP